MSEELWSHVTLRNMIMEIAESVAPHFKSRILDDKGNISRFISVKNIEFTYQNYGEIFEFYTDMELLTENGSLIQPILIRQFNSQDLYQQELEQHKKLEERCFFLNNVNVLSIISQDDQNLRITYEGTFGKLLHKTGLPQDLIDYQLGTLAASLQGAEILRINVEEFKSMVSYLITLLPFSIETQDIIKNLIENHYNILSHSQGGYNPTTIFDPSFFRFTPLGNVEKITKSMISNYTAFVIDIIPFKPAEDVTDRMVDLSMCYGRLGYWEYSETKSVKSIRKRMIDFLEGYELKFDKISSIPLEELYPMGLTLDFHMLINFWLLVYHKQFPGQKDISPNRSDLLQYTYYLLIHQPFKMYDSKSQELQAVE